MKYRIAAATSDGIHIDTHFGQAASFTIYEVDEETGSFEAVEERAVQRACSARTECRNGIEAVTEGIQETDPMEAAAERLADVDYVLAARIGPYAVRVLARHQIQAFDIVLPVNEAVERINRWRRRRTRLRKEQSCTSETG